MKENIESIYAEFPWWLLKDLPWTVTCSSNPKEPLLGFLRVCVIQSSLPEWKEVYLVDTKAMRVVDTAFLVQGEVKGVYLDIAEGILSLNSNSVKLPINTFISSWDSSSDVYESYIAKLISMKTACHQLKDLVKSLEGMKSISGVIDELKKILTKYESKVELMVKAYPQEYISKWGSPRTINELLIKR